MITKLTHRVEPALASTTRRNHYRMAGGVVAAAVVFALMPLGVLNMLFAIPLMGLCFTVAARADDEGRPKRTARTVVVAVLAVAAYAVVALFPYETVFLLSVVGADRAELVIAVAAALAVGLPLLLGSRSTVLAATGLVTLTLAHNTASTVLAMLALGLILPPVVAGLRIWQARWGRVETVLWRRPLSGAARPYLAQTANHVVLLGLAAATVLTGAYDILRSSLPGSGYQVLVGAFLGGLAVLALLATLPRRPVQLATNVLVAITSIFLAGQILWVYRPPVDPVAVGSPVSGEWYVVHGGRSELVNGHNTAVAQDYALDIVQVVNGSSHSGNADDRSNYFTWGEPLTAPSDGVVATVVDSFPDQPIGSVDISHPAGNHVALEIGGDRFVVFGHLQSGSIRVSVGDQVRRGDIIALVGNSGNSDEPHLHIQAQNSATFDVLDPPANLTTYPLLFDNMVLRRNGALQHPELADLRRGDTFQPVS